MSTQASAEENEFVRPTQGSDKEGPSAETMERRRLGKPCTIEEWEDNAKLQEALSYGAYGLVIVYLYFMCWL